MWVHFQVCIIALKLSAILRFQVPLEIGQAKKILRSKGVRAFGFTEEGVKIPGFTFEDDAASSRRATDAKIRFRNLVDRFPNKPVLELFRQIEMENMEAKERNLPSWPLVKSLWTSIFLCLMAQG